jgi:hypothetical protein
MKKPERYHLKESQSVTTSTDDSIVFLYSIRANRQIRTLQPLIILSSFPGSCTGGPAAIVECLFVLSTPGAAATSCSRSGQPLHKPHFPLFTQTSLFVLTPSTRCLCGFCFSTIVMEGTLMLPLGHIYTCFLQLFFFHHNSTLDTPLHAISLHNSISKTSSKLYHSNNIFSPSTWVRESATKTNRRTTVLRTGSLSLAPGRNLVQLPGSPSSHLALPVRRRRSISMHRRISEGCSVNRPPPLLVRRFGLDPCRSMISSRRSPRR